MGKGITPQTPANPHATPTSEETSKKPIDDPATPQTGRAPAWPSQPETPLTKRQTVNSETQLKYEHMQRVKTILQRQNMVADALEEIRNLTNMEKPHSNHFSICFVDKAGNALSVIPPGPELQNDGKRLKQLLKQLSKTIDPLTELQEKKQEIKNKLSQVDQLLKSSEEAAKSQHNTLLEDTDTGIANGFFLDTSLLEIPDLTRLPLSQNLPVPEAKPTTSPARASSPTTGTGPSSSTGSEGFQFTPLLGPPQANNGKVTAPSQQQAPIQRRTLQPLYMTYGNPITAKNQAEKILDEACDILESYLDIPGVAITYSANHGQTRNITHCYDNGQWKTGTSGANQASVMKTMEALQEEVGKYQHLQGRVRIAPISTMKYVRHNSKKIAQAVTDSELQVSLDYLEQLVKDGWQVLGWQNQDSRNNKNHPFAIGGGVAGNIMPKKHKDVIQNRLKWYETNPTPFSSG